MGHSLQKKLTLFVVVLILAMAALLSTVSYLQLRGQLLDSVRSESQAAAEGNTHFIEEWVVSKRSFAARMSGNGSVYRLALRNCCTWGSGKFGPD